MPIRPSTCWARFTCCKPGHRVADAKLDAAIAEAEGALAGTADDQRRQRWPGEMMPLVARYGLSPTRAACRRSLTPEEMKTLDEAAKLAGLFRRTARHLPPVVCRAHHLHAAMTRAGYDPLSGVDSKIEGDLRRARHQAQGSRDRRTADQGLRRHVARGRSSTTCARRSRNTANAPTELDEMVDQWSTADTRRNWRRCSSPR